jgi:uncharacterized protein with HEPN domain
VIRCLFLPSCVRLKIIGEAASKISAETRSAHAEIPWKAIIGMRNRLVHAYFDIDASIVWVAVTEELPTLAPATAGAPGD